MISYILLFIIFTFLGVFLYYLKRKYFILDRNRIIIKDNSIKDYSNSDLEEFIQRSEDNLVI